MPKDIVHILQQGKRVTFTKSWQKSFWVRIILTGLSIFLWEDREDALNEVKKLQSILYQLGFAVQKTTPKLSDLK